jgi:hypothetical protein
MKENVVKTKKVKKSLKTTRKEKPVVVDILKTEYIPRQFQRKYTETNNELNLYIPEKWQR